MIHRLVKSAFEALAFREDMAPQVILLMGLPAAGKSTFIKNEMGKYYNHRMPHIGAFQTVSSDVQVRKMQFERAKRDYGILKGIGSEEWATRTAEMAYKSNSGQMIQFTIAQDAFQKMGIKEFWQTMYKPYYATYFGERAEAKRIADEMLDRKVRAGDVVIIDATGTPAARYFKSFTKAKDQGYTTSVIWLDIPTDYCIARDKYRGETQGRSVGEEAIRSYETKLPAAYKDYAASDLVDRILHFRWHGEIIKGRYNLVQDFKRYPRKSEALPLAASTR